MRKSSSYFLQNRICFENICYSSILVVTLIVLGIEGGLYRFSYAELELLESLQIPTNVGTLLECYILCSGDERCKTIGYLGDDESNPYASGKCFLLERVPRKNISKTSSKNLVRILEPFSNVLQKHSNTQDSGTSNQSCGAQTPKNTIITPKSVEITPTTIVVTPKTQSSNTSNVTNTPTTTIEKSCRDIYYNVSTNKAIYKIAPVPSTEISVICRSSVQNNRAFTEVAALLEGKDVAELNEGFGRVNMDESYWLPREVWSLIVNYPQGERTWAFQAHSITLKGQKKFENIASLIISKNPPYLIEGNIQNEKRELSIQVCENGFIWFHCLYANHGIFERKFFHRGIETSKLVIELYETLS